MKKNHSQKSLASNFAFNLLYQILLYAVPFITTPYLSRVLQPEGIGRYSFAQSIVSYFVLAANLGTTMYGQRKIAALQMEKQQQSQAFWEIVACRFVTTSLALAAFLVLVVPRCPYPALYFTAALEIVVVGTDISWFYQGIERFDIISLFNGCAKLLTIILIFLIVKTPGDLNSYVLLLWGLTGAGHLMQWFCLPGKLEKKISLRLTEVGRHFRPAFALFIAQVAIQVYTVLDKTMIGVITHSEAQNAYYEQAQKLIRVLTVMTTFTGTVMASRIAALYREKKQEEIKKMIALSFRMVFAISCPMVVGVVLVAERFVPVFYGPGYEPVASLLQVLTLLTLVIGCSNVIGIQYLVPTNREKYLTFSVTVGAFANFFLNLVFIRQFQALGAAIASVAAEIIVTAVQLTIVRRELEMKTIVGTLLRYVLLSAPVLLIGGILTQFAPQGILGVLMIAAPCVVVYALELILLKDPVLQILSIRN